MRKISDTRRALILALLLMLAATLLAPPFRFHLTVAQVRPERIQLQGYDRSEVALNWSPPSYQHYLAAEEVGTEIRTEDRRVDSGRRVLWWVVLGLSALALIPPVMTRWCAAPWRARLIGLLIYGVGFAALDWAFVHQARPRYERWVMEQEDAAMLRDAISRQQRTGPVTRVP